MDLRGGLYLRGGDGIGITLFLLILTLFCWKDGGGGGEVEGMPAEMNSFWQAPK